MTHTIYTYKPNTTKSFIEFIMIAILKEIVELFTVAARQVIGL